MGTVSMPPRILSGTRIGFGEGLRPAAIRRGVSRSLLQINFIQPTTHAWRLCHSACAELLLRRKSTNTADGDFKHALDGPSHAYT
jgi:hypothetical protein